jgi:hypothetical protein
MHHLSNTYLDLGVRWDHQSGDQKPETRSSFRGLELITRSELTEWPMLGYDEDFGGYGLSHLHLAATFDWGKITVGDVYGQFGSGMVLRLYEDRALGVDNALRGGKIEATPYKGIYFTALGGKQRRYWNCYDDHAWGWNYKQDAVLGANLELGLHEWSEALQQAGANLTIGKGVGIELVVAKTAVGHLEGLVAAEREYNIKGSCSAIHTLDYGIGCPVEHSIICRAPLRAVTAKVDLTLIDHLVEASAKEVGACVCEVGITTIYKACVVLLVTQCACYAWELCRLVDVLHYRHLGLGREATEDGYCASVGAER